MSDFDPGVGWREVSSAAYATSGTRRLREDTSTENNGPSRYWVREEPVPPLPTEPYTVIRVIWRPERHALNDLFTRMPAEVGRLIRWRGEAGYLTPSDLLGSITGFEVLAVPVDIKLQETYGELRDLVRRETAKVVLDRVREESMFPRHIRMSMDRFTAIEREFEVES